MKADQKSKTGNTIAVVLLFAILLLFLNLYFFVFPGQIVSRSVHLLVYVFSTLSLLFDCFSFLFAFQEEAAIRKALLISSSLFSLLELFASVTFFSLNTKLDVSFVFVLVFFLLTFLLSVIVFFLLFLLFSKEKEAEADDFLSVFIKRLRTLKRLCQREKMKSVVDSLLEEAEKSEGKDKSMLSQNEQELLSLLNPLEKAVKNENEEVTVQLCKEMMTLLVESNMENNEEK